ncbi:unnamed protein product [Calypogeia fissa]
MMTRRTQYQVNRTDTGLGLRDLRYNHASTTSNLLGTNRDFFWLQMVGRQIAAHKSSLTLSIFLGGDSMSRFWRPRVALGDMHWDAPKEDETDGR